MVSAKNREKEIVRGLKVCFFVEKMVILACVPVQLFEQALINIK